MNMDDSLPPPSIREQAVEQQKHPFSNLDKIAMASLVGGFATDGASTYKALDHGAREANPLLPQNKYANMAGQAAYDAAIALTLNKLHKTHPKLASILGLAYGGVKIGVGVHNLGVVNKQEQKGQ